MNSQHLRQKWHFEKLDKYGPRHLRNWFSAKFAQTVLMFTFTLILSSEILNNIL